MVVLLVFGAANISWKRLGILSALGVASLLAIRWVYQSDALGAAIRYNIDRILLATSGQVVSDPVGGREVIWRRGLDVFRESPMLGVGLGGFRSTMTEYFGMAKAAHNGYLSVLVDTGLIGFVIAIAAVSPILYYLVIGKRGAHWWMSLAFVLGLATSFLTSNMEYDKVTWFCLSIVIYSSVINRHQQTSYIS